MKALLAYLQQPSTIKGIAAIVGVIAGAVAQAIGHSTSTSAATAAAVYGIIHVILPDNTAAQTSIEKLAMDTITAVVNKRLQANLPLLMADAVSVVQAVEATPAPVPVAVVQKTATPMPFVPGTPA